ncbi:MAG: VOC family protein [Pseudomonadales bacterium]|jgi:methylmalonyl-CoA/ethylmalonyl-CoA epimerase|nr:VOC family protein [Pseudomonadales bacterium]
MTQLSAPGAPFQYAWHVPDLEKAAEYWASVLGIGPFFVNEVDTSTYDGFSYRGGEGSLAMRLAWAQSKEGQIELIQVTSSEPNVYHDLIAPDQTAFHHVGIWSDDYAADKALLAEKYEIAMDMGTNTNICYFDTSDDSGNMVELIERNDGIVGLFGMITKAAEEWDGTRPVRTMAELMGG